MWIKTRDGIIVNSNRVKSFMCANGSVFANYDTPGNFDIIADYDNNKGAENCLNKLLNALVRDDAVFVVED